MCDIIVNSKTAENFNFALSNLKQHFRKKNEETSFPNVADKSFDLWLISGKDCLEITGELDSDKLTGFCKEPALAIIDGEQISVPIDYKLMS